MAEIDASIPLSGKFFDINNVIAAGRQGQLDRQADQDRASKNALSEYIRAKPANVSLSQHLEQGGFGDQALEAKKTETEIGKTEADSGKSQIEHHLKQLEMVGQINQGALYIPGLNKQKMYAYYKNKVDLGILPPESLNNLNQELANVPDDEQSLKSLIDTHIQGGLKVADSLKYRMPDANAQLSAQTTMRGQDITQQNNQFNQGMDQQEFGLKQSDSNFERKYKVAGLEVQRNQSEKTSNKATFDQEQKLADDHRALSKTFNEVRDGYTRLASALPNATKSAAATLAGATSFMKLLDPGSVVRESELGMSLAATGIFDRATNYFNVLQSGKVLTPSQAADFAKIGKEIYDAAAQNQAQLDAQFSERARKYGLDPKNIITDYSTKNNDANGSWEKPSDWEQFLKERGK
ncbi:MAG: hypothetical protein WC901_01025 [Candidatus Margulisiibacteriota bacterium]